MPSLNENLTTIRLLLDRPDPEKPGDQMLLQLLIHQVQHHLNQLQNSSAQWSVDRLLLISSNGQEDYLISADNFGKPFFVETSDSSDISFVRREVPFVMLQNKNAFYQGVQQTQISESHTAQLISFYRTGESWFARLTPIPGGSKTYTVWYETANISAVTLDASSGLSPFQSLICVQTALSALPACAWGPIRAESTGPEGEAWVRKTTALAVARGREEERFQKEFSTYIGTLMQSGIEARTPFGDDADSFWWNNVASW